MGCDAGPGNCSNIRNPRKGCGMGARGRVRKDCLMGGGMWRVCDGVRTDCLVGGGTWRVCDGARTDCLMGGGTWWVCNKGTYRLSDGWAHVAGM